MSSAFPYDSRNLHVNQAQRYLLFSNLLFVLGDCLQFTDLYLLLDYDKNMEIFFQKNKYFDIYLLTSIIYESIKEWKSK